MVLCKILADAKIVEQKSLAKDIFLMRLHAPDIAKAAKPGNFLQVKAKRGTTLLRRPLGIAEACGDNVSLIYRKIGKGTAELAAMQEGEIVSVMGTIGNTFNLNLKNPLLVGGGMGLSPLLFYAEYMKNASVLMGAKTSAKPAAHAPLKGNFNEDVRLFCNFNRLVHHWVGTAYDNPVIFVTLQDFRQKSHVKTFFAL